MPTHNHLINTNRQQTSDVGGGNFLAAGGAYATGLTSPDQLASGAVVNTGRSQPHDNLQPLLAVSFIIALQGLFPSRN